MMNQKRIALHKILDLSLSNLFLEYRKVTVSLPQIYVEKKIKDILTLIYQKTHIP